MCIRDRLGNQLGGAPTQKNRPTRTEWPTGVQLLWRDSSISFRPVEIKNPADYEVLVAAGTVPSQRRKVVVLGCYIPLTITNIKEKERSLTLPTR